MTLHLGRDGAAHLAQAVAGHLGELRTLFAEVPQGTAGVRITDMPALRAFLAPDGAIGRLAAPCLGARSRPVRALLLDKSPMANWSLGWHQDRTICVRRRVDVEGFGHWTMKAGKQHVSPPIALLARMLTLRVHLDDVRPDNSPLLIAPGSHKCGRIAEADIDAVVARHGIYACLADAGDVWAYATPILHASDRSRIAGRRRVLQVDYTAEDLPGGLEWLGV